MSKLVHELQNVNNIETVRSIQFGILSPEEIKEASVCEVSLPETYDGTEPKINGLFDPRMGVLDFGRLCPTDENDNEMCPGFFGHINLARPVFHYQFIPIIIKLLRCVCFRCSTILIDKSDPNIINEIGKKRGKNRFNYVYSKIAIKTKKCKYNDGCFADQPKKYIRLTADKIKEKDNIIKIIGEFNEASLKKSDIKTQQLFTPELCRNIFRNISEEDCELLGFSNKYSRPEWMICEVLPVCPPFVRPSVRQDNNQRAEDDLTHSLLTIIKTNNQLRQKIEHGADKRIIDQYEGALQLSVATYVDNDIPKVSPISHRSGRPYKTLRKRLKAKEGRIRGNIMGKRCDRSARTVISGDPNLSIDQFGVPIKIAMNITYPEIVTKYNIGDMYELIRNGPLVFPGAKSIVKNNYDCNGVPSPCELLLKYVDPNTLILHEGDIVNRHLQDGDIALFNRQPSLHRMSMMGHRIKIIHDDTFRLNVTVTTPYNADFDGDEMNMHVPNSLQTIVELEQLVLCPRQIISPASSRPIIKIVQDTLVGAYLFTTDDNRVSEYDMYNLLMFSKTFNGNFYPSKNNSNGNKKWTGQQIYSLILPDLSIKGRSFDVINGELTRGQLNKSVINSNLLQTIHNMYGWNDARIFLDSTQQLLTRWLVDHSFSIGFGDALPPKKIREEIKVKINDAVDSVYELIHKVYKGDFYDNIDNELRKQLFESEIMIKLNQGVEKASSKMIDYMKEHSPKNGFLITIPETGAGSKGSSINISQIMTALGQQDLWGKRIACGYTDRTLPHFPKGDQSPESRGFIKNSYIEGLTPTENFFHTMSGRIGVIDTAIKTASSGYISRRLIKGMEDLKIHYDYTVRNANGNIIQMIYGDDGFDPVKLESQSISLIKYSNSEMGQQFKFPKDIKWDLITTKKISNIIKKNKKIDDLLEKEFNNLMDMRHKLRYDIYKRLDIIDSVKIHAPFNLKRLIDSSIKKFKSGKLSNIDPEYILDSLDKLEKDITKYFKLDNNLILIKMLIRNLLSTKKVIVEYKLNKITFDYIIEHIKMKTLTALMSPGENVGVLAAQSLGEVSTQMVLNTFHSSGVASKSVIVTAGIPRLQELLNKSKKIKTPSMTVYLKDDIRFDRDRADKLKYELQFTTMKDIVEKTEILYETSELDVKTEEDEYINTFNIFNEILNVEVPKNLQTTLSKWTLKIIFNKEAMMNRNLTMNDVEESILYNASSDEYITTRFSDNNAGILVLKLKITELDDVENNIQFLNDVEKHILTLRLRGIAGIRKVGIEQLNYVKYHPDGVAENDKEWTLNTDGTNLLDLMMYDSIDPTRSVSNDINEIFDIFGIEGVRSKYIDEFSSILTEDKTNPRHIEVLSDAMTSKGIIMQIDRHGINKSADKGPIAKASFEEVSDVVMNAAVFAEVDTCKGVSANIMMGQFIKGGTNNFDILIDEEKILNNEYDDEENVELTSEDMDTLEGQLDDDFDIEDDIGDDDFDFGITIGDTKSVKKIKKIILNVK